MMDKNKLAILLGTLALVLLASCGGGSGSGDILVGKVWIATDINGALPLPDTTVSANFSAEGVVSGSAGCNEYSTSYTVDGKNISFGEQIAATQKLCSEPVNEQEAAYFQALAEADSFKATEDVLELFDADGNVVAAYLIQRLALENSSWDVIGYNNGQGGVVSVIIGTEITADFEEDGRLTGNAGCNNYSAAYAVEGGNISIEGVNATLQFCAEPEGVMEQEAGYLAALETATTFTIEGNRMELRTAENALVANFSRSAGQ